MSSFDQRPEVRLYVSFAEGAEKSVVVVGVGEVQAGGVVGIVGKDVSVVVVVVVVAVVVVVGGVGTTTTTTTTKQQTDNNKTTNYTYNATTTTAPPTTTTKIFQHARCVDSLVLSCLEAPLLSLPASFREPLLPLPLLPRECITRRDRRNHFNSKGKSSETRLDGNL